MQKNITRQALLAGLTVVLTIVILFAMTSAWYTNIVQTSGLTFEAEAWGFDGEITVDETATLIAPGDQGLVTLTVENNSTNVSAISVNVNRLEMEPEMQKRLFFYVDTQMNRDGETMDRVYVNTQEGYTYTVFSMGTLNLTKKSSNAPLLKWQWVYDMLGYYVLGQPIVTETDDDGNTVTTKISVREYLRPIEYDFDEATIKKTTDADGNSTMVITTVDGSTSPEAFLTKFSATDGYEGTVQIDKKTTDGYYPVQVDGDGYGVYAYLCSYSDIEMATAYDTMLGELAYRKAKKDTTLKDTETALLTHKATLNISAQQNESTAINVTTLNALQSIITAGQADVIQLSDDITIPSGSSLTIPANSRVMVDLNGKTITSSSSTAITGEAGSSLTLLNGTLESSGATEADTAISTVGSEVVMSDVDVTGFRYGVYLKDHTEGNSLDSRVHMENCTVDADWYAVYINGNGEDSSQRTQLIIERSLLAGGGYAITGSGNTDRCGTDIQILNSTLVQGTLTTDANGATTAVPEAAKTGAAIFQPQKDSSLYIYNSAVTGYTGIALKGGTLDIVESTISGVGTDSTAPTADNVSKSGFVDTADAVYIETNYGYEIGLTISGDAAKTILTSTAGKSLRVFDPNATNVTVKVYSGTFDQSQSAYLADGSTETTSSNKYVVTAAATAG